MAGSATEVARTFRRSHAVANHRRVLDAARDVFARRGLEAEVREIAESAGVGIGTIYRHFGSREALLASLLRDTEQDLLRRLRDITEVEKPEIALRRWIQIGAEMCERFGALTETILEGRRKEHRRGQTALSELLASLLNRGISTGAFRPDLDVPIAVAALKGAFLSGAFLEIAVVRSYQTAADAAADFFLAAVARAPEGASRRRAEAAARGAKARSLQRSG